MFHVEHEHMFGAEILKGKFVSGGYHPFQYLPRKGVSYIMYHIQYIIYHISYTLSPICCII